MTDDERYRLLCTLRSEMRQTYSKIKVKLDCIYSDSSGCIDEELSESLLSMYQYTEHYIRILSSKGDENVADSSRI